MPRHRVVYDKDLKKTMEWKTLYGRYNSNNTPIYRELFDNFLDFYNWAMANGFACGAKLARKDPSKPYTPDNCLWVMPEGTDNNMTVDEKNELIDRWDEAVNRIRVHFGLKPFPQKGDREQ